MVTFVLVGGSGLAHREALIEKWDEWWNVPRVVYSGSPIGPPIDAVIQAVDPRQRLVLLSVGREQKVEKGFQFFVYRGDRLVGKVQVIKVYEDLAGARILSTEPNDTIAIGDKAATQL